MVCTVRFCLQSYLFAKWFNVSGYHVVCIRAWFAGMGLLSMCVLETAFCA